MAGYTPMIEQYLATKRDYPEEILFFRLGDFYEMFFEDARIASRELDIVLTAREGGNKEKIPMCGVPHHAVNNYIARLISKGYRVALCDQVENPRQSVGIVKREVTRVITPGTVIDDAMLDESRNNYLTAIVDQDQVIGLAAVDISTGTFMVTELKGPDRFENLDNELQRLAPAECLLPAGSSMDSLWQDNFTRLGVLLSRIQDDLPGLETARRSLLEHFGVDSLDGFGVQHFSAGIQAAAAILAFINRTQKIQLGQINSLTAYENSMFLEIDSFSQRNLELTATLHDNKKEGSLLGVLDHCCTSMGKRTLRRWLEQPLKDLNAINRRLDAVGELVEQLTMRQDCRATLQKINDLERLAGKIGSGAALPRDLVALKSSLGLIPQLKSLLAAAGSDYLEAIAAMDPLGEVFQLIDTSINDDAPPGIKEGGIIKPGFRAEVDELKELASQGKTWLVDFENREKERTGIRTLKVGFNRVFGYYIEISKANLGLVPPEYIRKQTLVNAERFISLELKEQEEKILGARERLYELEYDLFMDLCKQLKTYIEPLQKCAAAIADLDVLQSLAQAAYMNDYVRPELTRDGIIDIRAGRHPVVEKSLTAVRFVPNDIEMDTDQARLGIITGPNMGGKSTYLRQTALLVIMAQMGSFIPADAAHIGVVDRIFTRVGASDDLSAGRSTFMVEMLELARIINGASRDSLVILDEIGRGTSTYDGLSIAQAASEYIHDHIKAKTLFATHYHELTTLADSRPGVFNLSVSVLESGDTVTFLKKVLPGRADKSYGIHVAKLAGIPSKIINRAYEILHGLEKERSAPKPAAEQLSLFGSGGNPILDELESMKLDDVSPRNALDLLYRWQDQLKTGA
ncbi:MAG TPA: DNA mismatch repair protein MutS [Syntrophomonadaceae bacterium]|nr:DNA mismatch repair protein MutS [Syntrophomonadaceae bacterium]